MKNWGLNVAGAALASALVLTAGVASAGGLNSRERYDDFPASSTPYFGGTYFGGSLGFAHVNVDESLTSGYYGLYGSGSDTQFAGGLHVGHNIQHGNIVYGVEGDVNFMDALDYSLSLRARYGVINNSWLFYGTAGIAYANGGGEVSGPGFHYDGYDAVGVAIGAGAETKLGRNLVAGVEAIYTSYAEDSQEIVPGIDYNVDVDTFTVRGRISWQLNGGRDYLK
jgi:outer membrane immunogenic protein